MGQIWPYLGKIWIIEIFLPNPHGYLLLMNVCGVTFGGYLAKISSFKTGSLLYNSIFHLLSEGTVIAPLESFRSRKNNKTLLAPSVLNLWLRNRPSQFVTTICQFVATCVVSMCYTSAAICSGVTLTLQQHCYFQC